MLDVNLISVETVCNPVCNPDNKFKFSNLSFDTKNLIGTFSVLVVMLQYTINYSLISEASKVNDYFFSHQSIINLQIHIIDEMNGT